MQEKAEGFQTVNRSRDADSLRVAFGREGCPVCIVVLDYLGRSMDSWEYEGFSDVEHRHELIQSRVSARYIPGNWRSAAMLLDSLWCITKYLLKYCVSWMA